MHVCERMQRSVRSSSYLPMLDHVDGCTAEGIVVHHGMGQQEHARAEGAAGCVVGGVWKGGKPSLWVARAVEGEGEKGGMQRQEANN